MFIVCIKKNSLICSFTQQFRDNDKVVSTLDNIKLNNFDYRAAHNG